MSIEASFVGNLGQDATFDPNKAEGMAKFSVAVRKKNRETGGFDTRWINIVCFKYAAHDAKHLKKGDRVHVSGDLWLRDYHNKEGVPQTSMDVVARKVLQLKRFERVETEDVQPGLYEPKDLPKSDLMDGIPF